MPGTDEIYNNAFYLNRVKLRPFTHDKIIIVVPVATTTNNNNCIHLTRRILYFQYLTVQFIFIHARKKIPLISSDLCPISHKMFPGEVAKLFGVMVVNLHYNDT